MDYVRYSNFEGEVLITSVKPGKGEYENGGDPETVQQGTTL